ncbi:putative membrane protein YphA (DoxX/SURF4 family) [Kribbella aluminosa]|uniref:Membrane protein YphA (DoxX/SURF4 family) n=1 Tax=Kribbella aluminosa TaxID=416017 RepID=A0ABS4UTX7_9ACTN|nr:DoxX family protein [Kribbella aluminosa]MBP2355087.1 putative membrane protein YphA (DoxX/SURF4 family) [Kribbella aluminosa]
MNTTTVRRVRPGTAALWMVQVVLAAMFVMAGLPKLSGDPVMVDIFDAVGAGQWLRYVVGVLELAGAIGLLVPRLCGPAALGLSFLLVGATLTNLVAIGASPAIPLGYLLMAAGIVWFRRASIQALVAAVARTAARR